MPNLVNKSITAEYEDALSGDIDALFVQPIGLTVEEANEFRSKLAESDLRMRVVKGSLARRVLESQGLSGVEPLFDGPAALIVAGNEDVEAAAIAASRVVAAWRKESGNAVPAIKGGIMEGEVLGEEQAAALAKLPTKADMQSILVGQILSPGRTLSGQLVAGGRLIAGAIKTHIGNLEPSD